MTKGLEPKAVGRPLLWPEKMVAPLPLGTKARISASLREGEGMTDFVREAVDRELRRRGRARPKESSDE